MADVVTNGQRAATASRAIHIYAQALELLGRNASRDSLHEPRLDQDRLARLLCDLKHHTDRISGLRFDAVLDDARENYERQRASHVGPSRVAAAAHAIDIHEGDAQHDERGDSGPPEATADLLAALIADLRYYADAHDLDFAEALTASEHAYTEQRLNEEGSFSAGCDTQSGAVLPSSPTAPSFRPVATPQGVVTSINDAEWLLVRTAGRLHELERRGLAAQALPDDISERRTLAEALAAACGLTESEILGQLAPQITARADEIEYGTAGAAEMGHQHGIAGIEPYCRLDMDSHDSRFMDAFGETEPTTDTNALHRLALIQVYVTAYGRARKHVDAAPAHLAEHDFPQGPGKPSNPDGSLPPSSSARTTPSTESRSPRKRP